MLHLTKVPIQIVFTKSLLNYLNFEIKTSKSLNHIKLILSYLNYPYMNKILFNHGRCI